METDQPLHTGRPFIRKNVTCKGEGLIKYVSKNCSEKVCFTHLTDCALKRITVERKEECCLKKFLVYKCDECCCGGWGDRLKGIVSSFLLALLTERVFIINMKQPCDLESILDHRIYDWSICKEFIHSTSDKKLVNIIKPVDKLEPDISDEDFDDVWYEKIVEITTRVQVVDTIKNHKYARERLPWIENLPNEETTHLLMNTLLKGGRTLLESKEEWLHTLGYRRKLVCAHVRMGRNPSNPLDKIPYNGIGKRELNQVFSFLESYTMDIQYSTYIASDSDMVKKLAEKVHHMHTINKSIVHIDLPVQDRYSFDVCQGLFTLLLEHYILASCDILLLTKSNFGGTAAYMRGKSEGLFILSHENNVLGNGIIKIKLSDLQGVFNFK